MVEKRNISASESHSLSCLVQSGVDIKNFKVDPLGFIESLQLTVQKSLPSGVFFPRLKKLSIYGKRLFDTDFLNNNINLNSLFICDCSLKEIPYLDNLTNLKELDLIRTQINSTSNIKYLTNLRILDLRWNCITEPTGLEATQKLQNLGLSTNKITSLHFLKQLVNHKALSSISLDENLITDLEGFQYLTALQNLRSIDLTSNKITDINLTQDISGLKYLYLNKNSINNIYSLKNFSNLKHVEFSNNQISTLKNLSNLHSLSFISLNGNPIRHFLGLENVKSEFNIVFDNIKSFTEEEINELEQYCRLHDFYLELNPEEGIIATPPETICEFKVNDYICLKLIGVETFIFVGGEKFNQCHALLLTIPIIQNPFLSENPVLDEIVGEFSTTDDMRNDKLPPRAEFWGHCSSIQSWAENNYNTNLLDMNLAFPLLKRLTELGCPIAKKVFKEEIAKRYASNYPPVMEFLEKEGFLRLLNEDELSIL